MNELLALLLGVVSLHMPTGLSKAEALAKAEAEVSEAINIEELKAHVYRLASDEFEGRRGPGAARTSRHLAEMFQNMGLAPAFGDSYFQPIANFIPDKQAPKQGSLTYLGRNVGAILPGSDPKLKHEWILLSAHFDHLGTRGNVIYPGADDNASGVSMLLEVAERFSQLAKKPRRSIVFVAFDLEEAGLIGSRYFAMHPPWDLKHLKTFITADMLGRSMANVMDEFVFLMGTESATRLAHLAATVPPDERLKVGCLGTDIIGTRSDYGPFRDRKIPFLFFSTGQHPDYHRPSDSADRINYVRLAQISRWIAALTERLANDDETPVWNDDPEPNLEEVKTISTLLKRVMESPDSFRLSDPQRRVVETIDRRLSEIVGRGRITRTERGWLIWTSRILLATVF